MKSLQDYIDTYRTIAQNLGLTGDSVTMLVQMLANASYISEVENIAYAQEASLEKCTLLNSKIQHCINEMYSVYRGACPRVIISFKPTKYFNLEVFDELVSSNNFKIYYLGYYSQTANEATSSTSMPEFTYGPLTIPPSTLTNPKVYTIVGLLANETVSKSWQLDQTNTYYVDCLEENLSNDMWVKINSEYFEVTREFSDHIINSKVFDLTLPSLGSRLYVADIFKTSFSRDEVVTPSNTSVEAFYFKNSTLDSYNLTDLKRVSIKGAELVDISEDINISNLGYLNPSTGLYYVKEAEADTIPTIHYKASRDRYVNSILRSNSDVGVVLEETYPEKIRANGTSYTFSTSGSNVINIYYVPKVNSNLLTDDEILNFIETKAAYYITDAINIYKGNQYLAVIELDLEIFQNSSVENEVANILTEYESKFNVDLLNQSEEIRSLISKISNVRRVMDFSIVLYNSNGVELSSQEVESIDKGTSYYEINYVINSVLQTKSV